MLPPIVTAVLIAEMGLAALVWSAFVVHYHFTTSGRCDREGCRQYHVGWAGDDHGRNVMSTSFMVALMVDFTIAGLVLPMPVMVAAALLLWPGLAIAGAHRHWLLWKDQHAPPAPCLVCGVVDEPCGLDVEARPFTHTPPEQE